MNVTVYGDSILKGVLLEGGRYIVEHGWEQKLAERFGLHVENRSRFGCTIRKALERIRKDAETVCDGTEYALLEFGGNDCDFDWAEVSAAPEGEHNCKTPPQLFLDVYRRAIRLLRDAGRTPVLTTLPPINAELYLRFLCRDGLSRENIVRWLGDVERIYRWQENYSQMAEQLSREESTPLIDLRRPFLQDARPPKALLCADGIHPSRLGQGLIYETFCAALG
ncbi:MAG: SGNH/GDSL hydrolase family protein [Ruminococcaceae bacterium]|jgi:lysophospholipase L1-like esterase|nr:SGNH/GDSL hydrolase family protein [Oscillospiraceae bacterium]